MHGVQQFNCSRVFLVNRSLLDGHLERFQMFALTNSVAAILHAVSSVWNEFRLLFSLVQFFYLPSVKSSILPLLDCFDLLGWHNMWCLHIMCDDYHNKVASQYCIVYVKVDKRVDLQSSYLEKKRLTECYVLDAVWPGSHLPFWAQFSPLPHTPWILGPHPLLRCPRLPLPLAWSAYTHSLSFSVSFSEKFSLISQHWVECPLYMLLSLSLSSFGHLTCRILLCLPGIEPQLLSSETTQS